MQQYKIFSIYLPWNRKANARRLHVDRLKPCQSLGDPLLDNSGRAHYNLLDIPLDELHLARIHMGVLCLPHERLIVADSKSGRAVAEGPGLEIRNIWALGEPIHSM